MSKKANLSLIGGFVLGAIILAVAGVMVFGSGKFLEKKEHFVLFFQGSSLKGLTVGAPVMFRGVRVGEVTDITVLLNPATLAFKIPVFITLKSERFKPIGKWTRLESLAERKRWIDLMIDKGLRAQLQLQSLVTGQLFINLDLRPDTPVRLEGLKELRVSKDYLEIPTIPSLTEEIGQTLENLPIKEMVQDIQQAANGVNRLVNSPELADGIRGFRDTSVAAQKLLTNLDQQVSPLVASLEETMADLRRLLQAIDRRIEPASADLKSLARSAEATLQKANETLTTVKQVTAEGALLRPEISKLQEISRAARSVRILADYLERHPDALLRGKTRTGGE
ncbi:MAG: MCE family protein [Deltaproteobacteria bacterium]|nr:MCE family protein [Deltaproteobacteria bacterium]